MTLLAKTMNTEKLPFLLQLDSSEVVENSDQDMLTIHEPRPWAVPRNVEDSAMMDSSMRTDVNQETTDDE